MTGTLIIAAGIVATVALGMLALIGPLAVVTAEWGDDQ